MGFKRMVSLSMAAALSVPICCANSGYQKSAADETQDMVTLLECGFENGTEGWTGSGRYVMRPHGNIVAEGHETYR